MWRAISTTSWSSLRCLDELPFALADRQYLDDRDVFQKFYAKHLAKRLVQSLSASDDAEASMLSKLKVCVGCVILLCRPTLFTHGG